MTDSTPSAELRTAAEKLRCSQPRLRGIFRKAATPVAEWLESLAGVEISEHAALPEEYEHALAVARAVNGPAAAPHTGTERHSPRPAHCEVVCRPHATTNAAPDVDTCHTVTIDGVPLRVHGSGELTDQARGYLAEIIAAARRRHAAEEQADLRAAVLREAIDVAREEGHRLEEAAGDAANGAQASAEPVNAADGAPGARHCGEPGEHTPHCVCQHRPPARTAAPKETDHA